MSNDESKKIGERIRAERERQGLDAVDLAIRAGCSADFLRRLESGRSIKPETVAKVAAALGVTVAALLGASLL